MKMLTENKRHCAVAPAFPEKFWAHVDKSGPIVPGMSTPCWPWTAYRGPDGYGRSGYQRAHRRAYALVVGPIPAGQCVLHRCDNRPCVNPTHLFLGTRKDNADDMHGKGRGFPPPLLRGLRHPKAKLTDDQVREIRRRYASDGRKKLAAEFGLYPGTVYKIATRVHRGFVPDTAEPVHD